MNAVGRTMDTARRATLTNVSGVGPERGKPRAPIKVILNAIHTRSIAVLNHPIGRMLQNLGLALLTLVLLAGVLPRNVAHGATDDRTVMAGLVEVRGVNRIGREYPIASGFVVNSNGFVATVGQSALKDARKVVVAPFLGAGASFEVTQREYHPALEMTLLHVPGLRGRVLTLADAETKGQSVMVPLNKDQQFAWSRGVISGFIVRSVQAYGGSERRFITHNTDLHSPSSYGTPLLNELGQVVGINHRNPDLPASALARNTKPSGRSFAVPTADLAEFLRTKSIMFESAGSVAAGRQPAYQPTTQRSVRSSTAERSTEVPTAEVQAQFAKARERWEQERRGRREAQREAVEARSRAEEMARLAKEAESKSAVSEQEREAARRAARAASAAADAAEEAAEAATTRALEAEKVAKEMEERAAAAAVAREAANEQAAEARRNFFVIGIVGGIVVLMLAFWFYLHSRRSAARVGKAEARAVDAEEDAQKAQVAVAQALKPAPFSCLLEGQAPEGRRYALKIPASALGVSEGVVIGRNPEHAEVVVDHKGISRQHAKLSVIDDTLHIEDLNSTNGSFVNDVRLVPTQRLPLREGFTVRLGPIPFTVKLS